MNYKAVIKITTSPTSDQDGGIGRYTSPPRTIKRQTTTNLKTKNNQNCQKTKLYGSQTTKELKKKYSPRMVGGAEMDSRDREDKEAAGAPGGPIFRCR